MKLYGQECTDLPPAEINPLPLAEITLVATPIEPRATAKFLADCADEMERMGSSFDHVHLGDRIKRFRDSPHVVVARE